MYIWGFTKIRDTFLGAPVIRIVVFWGLYWGLPILGKLPYIYIYIHLESSRDPGRVCAMFALIPVVNVLCTTTYPGSQGCNPKVVPLKGSPQ